MFALRAAAGASARASSVRSYATLREIEMRLKSIKNIEKITNTMKIVASTRLSKAQRAMAVSRTYGTAQQEVFNKAETAAVEEPTKRLVVAMTSDKGLCGSIHSQLSRATKAYLREHPDADVVAIGEKVKVQISRAYPNNMVLSIAQIGKETPTFSEAAIIADQITKLGEKYDEVQIFYNKFVSGVSFEPTQIQVFNQEAIESSPKFGTFEIEDEVIGNLSEFSLANYILWGLSEGHAAEISARRNAMDNASKNANEMIGKFTILYNRTRQAVITNELVDIITGASSLE
ncbi:ATP synthase subunit gamma, mitochondrial [Trichomonascus vanleenenianus]|uniref:F1F0 ATP synthase subunit gamma n=1 Tax=Trichomonascus vanleenenianus TaxID=2268995 RepID=UPI003ECA3ED1